MNRKERFQDSLDTIADLDKKIRQEFRERRRAEILKRGIDPDKWGSSVAEIKIVNEIFETVGQEIEYLRIPHRQLVGQFISELLVDDFLESDPQAIDIALDFLELFYPPENGLRLCGYYYTNFHLLKLNETQILRLQQLTLQHCCRGTHKAVLSYFAQIMESHCNDDVRPKLHTLAQDTQDSLVRERVGFVLSAMDILVAHKERGVWERIVPIYEET